MTDDNLPLGKQTTYITCYTPDLLCPITRDSSRASLKIDSNKSLPFFGVDIWTAYELSWLSPTGKPEVACAEIIFPAASESIVESKSLKLYFNSFNQTHFVNENAVLATVREDLSRVVNDTVEIRMLPVTGVRGIQMPPSSVLLDDMVVDADQYHPDDKLLVKAGAGKSGMVTEALHSHLLRSLCPVTGQPDWATLFINYRGEAIDHQGLLKYIISYREHQDFHEHCVERIFMDISKRCEPVELSVYARYLRRGGLDINPYRSSRNLDGSPLGENLRLYRQ